MSEYSSLATLAKDVRALAELLDAGGWSGALCERAKRIYNRLPGVPDSRLRGEIFHATLPDERTDYQVELSHITVSLRRTLDVVISGGTALDFSRDLFAMAPSRDTRALADRLRGGASLLEKLPEAWRSDLTTGQRTSRELGANSEVRQSDNHEVAPPPHLNDTERNILGALGDGRLTGEEIAKKLEYPFNSSFRATLSGLRKRGLLDNLGPGYRRVR